MIAANYFDGKSNQLHPVTLVLAHGSLHIQGDGMERHIPLHEVKISEPFAHAAWALDFVSGGRCEISALQDRKLLAQALRYKPSLVERLQRRWQGALAAVIIMLSLFLLARAFGVPWAAEELAARVPLAVEQRVGAQSVAALDKNLFVASQAPTYQLELAQRAMDRIRPAQTRMPIRLLVRKADLMGPNAFALPDGSIIVTDALLQLLAEKAARQQEELLMAVLAHELGHLEHRHSLKNMIASSLFGAISWSLLGDFSGVAAAAPSLLLQLEFSREMEIDADVYAWRLLQEKGQPTENLFEALALLENLPQRKMGSQVPGWMRSSADYLSTHPQPQQRRDAVWKKLLE